MFGVALLEPRSCGAHVLIRYRYLNGRGRGARYDGSYAGSRGVGSCQGYTSNGAAFSADYKVCLITSPVIFHLDWF